MQENLEIQEQTQEHLPAEGPDSQENQAQADSPEIPTLTGLLAGDKGLQSQFDKLVSKALATAQARWEKEKEMSAEELAQAKAQEKARELDKREQELKAKELRAQALEALGERGIPSALIDCVSLADREAMETSLAKAEEAFRTAVDRAVREKMAGVAPKGSVHSTTGYMAQLRAAAGIKNK